MKVLFYAPNYFPATRYGGPVRSSHGLVKALVRQGHDVDVYTTNEDGPGTLNVPLGQPVKMDGANIYYFGLNAPKRLYYSNGMCKRLKTAIKNADIVHINGMFLWPGPYLAKLARRNNVPYVVSPRGMLVPELIAGKSTLIKNLWISLLERKSLENCAAIHVTSDEEAMGVKSLGLDLSPLKIIGNGVDAPSENHKALENKIWMGIPKGQRIAFLGRLDWTKGVDLAIEATIRIERGQILIAGSDQIGLRKSLESKLTVNGANRGQFIGEVKDEHKWAFLSGADVLIAPSVKESFGMSVAESLSVGTPVICTPGVGAATIIRKFTPDCVVERNANALSQALELVLTQNSRFKTHGEQFRQYMAESYSWDYIGSEIETIYLNAIAE